MPVTAQDAGVAPRPVPDRPAVIPELPPGTRIERMVLKFREGSDVRLEAGRLQAHASAGLPDLAAALRSAGADPATVRRLHDRPPAELAAEREEAIRRGRRELADLNLYYTVEVPAATDPAAFLARLNALPGVEFAEPMPPPAPPPVDIAPPSPNLVARQGYRAAAPSGIGVLTAAGGDGAGTSLVDVEYGWALDHEDLELPAGADIDTATGVNPFPDDGNHGTAVLGEIGGRANAYGVTGIVPAARLLVAPANTAEFGYNPARAISLAVGRLSAGDVILIEQQTWVCASGDYGPLEWITPVFDAIAAATAAGITVVEAAGNGSVDLDDAGCAGRFDRRRADSGAIIVGAGAPADRSRLGFSSHGSRVDVQGWGTSVTTAGYGDAFDPGDVRQRYTHNFGGTSSASPIVAGAVLALQGSLKAQGLRVATPQEIREALVATGTPAPAGARIGPLPNLAAALSRLLERIAPDPRWRGWESFAGVSTTNPECLAGAAGSIDCWTRLAGGGLGWWRYAGGGTPAVRAIAGAVAGPPSCLVAGGRLHCFAVRPSGRLGQTSLNGASWGAWADRGGALKRKPACATPDGSRIVCVGLGANGGLMERSGTGDRWGAWRAVGGALRFNHPPTCYARAGGIDCVAADATFRGRFLRRAADGAWAAPRAIGGPVDDVPSCVAPRTTTRTCFFKGRDRGLRRVFFNGAAWGAVESLGGTMDSAPSCTLLGPNPHCFAVIGAGLQVKRNVASAWQPWGRLGGSLRALRPSCLATGGTRIDCFALGSGGDLAHNAFR